MVLGIRFVREPNSRLLVMCNPQGILHFICWSEHLKYSDNPFNKRLWENSSFCQDWKASVEQEYGWKPTSSSNIHYDYLVSHIKLPMAMIKLTKFGEFDNGHPVCDDNFPIVYAANTECLLSKTQYSWFVLYHSSMFYRINFKLNKKENFRGCWNNKLTAFVVVIASLFHQFCSIWMKK